MPLEHEKKDVSHNKHFSKLLNDMDLVSDENVSQSSTEKERLMALSQRFRNHLARYDNLLFGVPTTNLQVDDMLKSLEVEWKHDIDSGQSLLAPGGIPLTRNHLQAMKTCGLLAAYKLSKTIDTIDTHSDPGQGSGVPTITSQLATTLFFKDLSNWPDVLFRARQETAAASEVPLPKPNTPSYVAQMLLQRMQQSNSRSTLSKIESNIATASFHLFLLLHAELPTDCPPDLPTTTDALSNLLLYSDNPSAPQHTRPERFNEASLTMLNKLVGQCKDADRLSSFRAPLQLALLISPLYLLLPHNLVKKSFNRIQLIKLSRSLHAQKPHLLKECEDQIFKFLFNLAHGNQTSSQLLADLLSTLPWTEIGNLASNNPIATWFGKMISDEESNRAEGPLIKGIAQHIELPSNPPGQYHPITNPPSNNSVLGETGTASMIPLHPPDRMLDSGTLASTDIVNSTSSSERMASSTSTTNDFTINPSLLITDKPLDPQNLDDLPFNVTDDIFNDVALHQQFTDEFTDQRTINLNSISSSERMVPSGSITNTLTINPSLLITEKPMDPQNMVENVSNEDRQMFADVALNEHSEVTEGLATDNSSSLKSQFDSLMAVDPPPKLSGERSNDAQAAKEDIPSTSNKRRRDTSSSLSSLSDNTSHSDSIDDSNKGEKSTRPSSKQTGLQASRQYNLRRPKKQQRITSTSSLPEKAVPLKPTPSVKRPVLAPLKSISGSKDGKDEEIWEDVNVDDNIGDDISDDEENDLYEDDTGEGTMEKPIDVDLFKNEWYPLTAAEMSHQNTHEYFSNIVTTPRKPARRPYEAYQTDGVKYRHLAWFPYDDYDERVSSFVETAKRFHDSNDQPRWLGKDKGSSIRLLSYEEYKSLSTTTLHSIIAVQSLVVSNAPCEGVEFNVSALQDLKALQTVVSLQDYSYPCKPDSAHLPKTVRGTVRQLLDNALQGHEGKIVNGLDFSLSHVPFQSAVLATDKVGWSNTESEHLGELDGRYPYEEVNWAIVGTTDTVTFIHMDCDGFGTIIKPRTGMKFWAVITPSDPEDTYRTSTFLSEDFHLDKIQGDSKWKVEIIALRDTDMLILRPGTLHMVLGIQNTICLGTHFYTTSTLQLSAVNLIHSFTLSSFITNTSHTGSRLLLRRIFLFCISGLFEKRIDTDDLAESHLPDIQSPEGLINLLALACLMILNNVLDFRTYSAPNQAASEHRTVLQTELLVQHDRNHIPVKDRLAACYARGLAWELLRLVDEHVVITRLQDQCEVKLGYTMLTHYINSVRNYKAQAMGHGLKGAPHCTTQALNRQLNNVINWQPTLSIQNTPGDEKLDESLYFNPQGYTINWSSDPATCYKAISRRDFQQVGLTAYDLRFFESEKKYGHMTTENM